MAKDPHRDVVKAFLEETGYQVQFIPEVQGAGENRADLLAVSMNDTLIVEVKSRLDEDGFAEQVNRTTSGQHVGFQHKIQRNETLSKAIKHASRQIEKTRAKFPNAFGVVWIRPQQAFGLFESEESTLATLLGVRFAHVTDPHGSSNFRKCYYCGFSDFYRYRNIAAVVFNKASDGLLIPNEWCPESNAFRTTLLYRDYEKAGAIFDPTTEEATCDALILRREADFKHPDSIAQALHEQYPGLQVIFADIWEVGGVVPLG